MSGKVYVTGPIKAPSHEEMDERIARTLRMNAAEVRRARTQADKSHYLSLLDRFAIARGFAKQ